MICNDINPCELELTLEQQRVVIDHAQNDDVQPDPPMVKLYGWTVIGKVIVADRYENHPKLGSRMTSGNKLLRTTPIVWINREVGLARTLNTLYVLVGPEAK